MICILILFRILSGSSKEVRCLIGSYCRPTSVVSWLTETGLKIRLLGLATPWSGVIPLEAVTGKRKSFMVKLPLRDKLGSTRTNPCEHLHPEECNIIIRDLKEETMQACTRKDWLARTTKNRENTKRGRLTENSSEIRDMFRIFRYA